MRFRTYVALVGISLGGCKAGRPPTTPDASVAAAKPGEHLMEAARQKVIDSRRVALDRRFTRALVDVATLTGQPACTATPHGAQTTIACGAQTRDIAELADFEALHDALATAVAGFTLTAGEPPAESTAWLLDGVAPALARARAAGQRWATTRTQGVALDGLHGLLSTLLAEEDSFGITDSVAARALALLAITERSGPRPLEAALLAHVLGYETAGARLASALPTTEPVRDFLVQPLAAAARTEADEHASPLSLYLAHRVLLEAGESTRAAKLRARMEPMLRSQTGVQAARLIAPRFREPVLLGPLLPWLGLADARELSAQPAVRGTSFESEADVRALAGTDLVQVLQQLSAAVKATDKSGAFVEGGLIDDHFRALVASADDVYRLGVARQLELPELDDVAHERSTRPPEYEEGHDWQRFATTLLRGKTSQRTMPEYLKSPRSLVGAAPLEPVLQAFWTGLEWRAPAQREIDVEVHRRADGRPAFRPLLAQVAWHMLDLARYFELGRSWQSVAGARASTLGCLMTIGAGHAADVHAQLADEALPKATRRAAFDALEQAQLLDVADKKAMGTLVVKDDASASAVAAVAALLAPVDPRGAEALCTTWLRDHPDEHDTQDAAALLTELATLQQARNDLAAAQQTLAPALARGGDAAVHRGALLRLARKDVAGAEALVRSHLQAHPDATSIGIAVEILLRSKHYAPAADLLAKPPVPLSRQAIIDQASPFIVTALPDEAAVKAFVAQLTRAGFNTIHLFGFEAAFVAIGRDDLAFTSLTLIPTKGFQIVEIASAAYSHLVVARGSAAADKWVRENVPPELLLPFGAFAEVTGAVDVVFTVVPDPVEVNAVGDVVWGAKALALAKHHERSGPRWDRVQAHYTKGKGASYFDSFGRLLVGTASVADVESAVDKAEGVPYKIGEAGTFLGIDALDHGRGVEALDWLQVPLHVGTWQDMSFHEAEGILRQLARTRLDPEQLAKQWTAR